MAYQCTCSKSVICVIVMFLPWLPSTIIFGTTASRLRGTCQRNFCWWSSRVMCYYANIKDQIFTLMVLSFSIFVMMPNCMYPKQVKCLQKISAVLSVVLIVVGNIHEDIVAAIPENKIMQLKHKNTTIIQIRILHM